MAYLRNEDGDMRNLITEEGELDLETAANEMRSQVGAPVADPLARDRGIIVALALLDIAASQRTIATESMLAMQTAGVYDLGDDEEDEGEGDPRDDVDLTEAAVGTRVMLRIGNDPDEGPRTGMLTGNGGISEGLPWVGVHWDDDDGGEDGTPTEARVFVPHLEPYTPVAPIDEPDLHDRIDDVDSDFDESTSTPDGLAARRAKKKGGKK